MGTVGMWLPLPFHPGGTQVALGRERVSATEEKLDRLDLIKAEKLCLHDNFTESKDSPQAGLMLLQISLSKQREFVSECIRILSIIK